MKRGLYELALFAGAGGGILGGKLLGWRTICAVEINSYATSVLVARQNDGCLEPFPIWDDVRTFNGKPWRGRADIVSAGFPCQVFSGASRGRRVAENLWPEAKRIIGEVQPGFVFAENVTKKSIEAAARDLRSMGYVSRAVALSASDMGADHIRKRYWLFAYADGDGELLMRINAEMAKLQRIRARVWKTYSKESRMDDGMAHYVDRTTAIGNGQIPCVAAKAWKILTGLGPVKDEKNLY